MTVRQASLVAYIVLIVVAAFLYVRAIRRMRRDGIPPRGQERLRLLLPGILTSAAGVLAIAVWAVSR